MKYVMIRCDACGRIIGKLDKERQRDYDYCNDCWNQL